MGHLDKRCKPGLPGTPRRTATQHSALDGAESTRPLSVKRALTKEPFPQMGHGIPVHFPQRQVIKSLPSRHFHFSPLSLPTTPPATHALLSVQKGMSSRESFSNFSRKNKCILLYRMKSPPPPCFHMSTFPVRRKGQKNKVNACRVI